MPETAVLGPYGLETRPSATFRPPPLSGLKRERLLSLMPGPGRHRLTVLVAPAGSGKTTLLTHFAAAAEGPVAWLAVDSSDVSHDVFLERLEEAYTGALPRLDRGWRSVEAAAAALERCSGSGCLLIIDDFQWVHETAAEQAVERLLSQAPPDFAFVISSRTRPNMNLPRLVVSGTSVEVGADDLRFRSWEAERLFRDFYREPLPPEDLAALTRRTDGWPAGLQLFHLATRGKPAGRRRATLAALTMRWDAAREYLARNVLDDLPGDLRHFLLRTCVLGRLSGRLCDDLLGTTGSDRMLADLERRQIFTSSAGGPGDYRYHEVLRAHLDEVLTEELGEVEVRRLHRQAGRLLEREGAHADALLAYCRAGDRVAVERLLGRNGENVVEEPNSWLDLLPPSLIENEPWLLLAHARRQRATGSFDHAIEAYRVAERAFDGAPGAEVCRRERLCLATWLDASFGGAPGWAGVLRAAATHDPDAARRAAARLDGPLRAFAAGVAALLGGRLGDAESLFLVVREHLEAPPALAAAARTGQAVALLLRGDGRGDAEADLAAEECDALGLTALARVAHAAHALGSRRGGVSEAACALRTSEQAEDRWGVGFTGLLGGLGTLARGGDPGDMLDRAAQAFDRLGAGVLAAWARSARAVARARAGDEDASRAARQAAAEARSRAAWGAEAVATLAFERDGGAGADSAASEAECATALRQRLRTLDLSEQTREATAAPALRLRCFGGFSIAREGRELEISSVRPRARQALRLLAVTPGRPVHREVMTAALWPDADPETANRNLHVAVSSLRRALRLAGSVSDPPAIKRDGEAYRLDLPAGADCDVLEFEQALEAAGAARRGGDLAGCVAALERAVELHAGELLPEEGPAEWVVPAREVYRSQAAGAARAAAEVLLDAGEPARAARSCELGLSIDQYDDSLWRLCMDAYERAGERAAAVRARRRYTVVLEELGLQPEQART